jgi:tetratricopeptide (TPR) repeat protein
MTLVSEGIDLKEKSALDAAQEIFEYVTEIYPASANGYWQLANLHRERGNHEKAIEYYRKCLEIIPNMRPARDWIEKLETQE